MMNATITSAAGQAIEAHNTQKQPFNQLSHAQKYLLVHLTAAMTMALILSTCIDLDSLLRRVRNFHSY
jgi:hypothetical protein